VKGSVCLGNHSHRGFSFSGNSFIFSINFSEALENICYFSGQFHAFSARDADVSDFGDTAFAAAPAENDSGALNAVP